MSNNNTLTYNFNELIVAKQQLKSIIQEGGLEPGDVFAQYPGYIASIIDGGGTSTYVINDCIAYYLDTYNYIDLESLESMSYATQSYVIDKINAIPSIDLSSYVTHTDLNNASYVTSTALENASYITTGYISTHDIVPADDGFYQLGNAAYKYIQISTNYALVTNQLVFGRQKITHQDDSNSLTVVTNNFDRIIFNDNGIIPAANNTYTLGDSTHLYDATYTTGLYFRNNNNSLYSAGQYTIGCKVNGTLRYSFMAGSIKPEQSNVDLGTSAAKWANTYTSNLYADTTYTQSVNLNHTSRNGWIISSEGSGNELQLKPYNAQRTLNIVDYYGNKILRMYANSSSTNYSYSYCVTYFDKPVYFNDTTNLVWTGTSAEYALLDNYTSYQIYLIQEA